MKQTHLTEAIQRVIALKMKAVDIVIDSLIEPIADVGNPEKLINKKYEQWTPQDIQMLVGVYGTQEPNPLSEVIFRHSYERLKALEAEEGR